MAHKLTLDEISKYQQDYQQNKQNKIAELAVVNNGEIGRASCRERV